MTVQGQPHCATATTGEQHPTHSSEEVGQKQWLISMWLSAEEAQRRTNLSPAKCTR